MTRLLVVGWINSPHVYEWAQEFQQRGFEVHLAGEEDPALPPVDSPAVAALHRFEASGPPGTRARRMSTDLGELAAELAPDVTHAHWLTSFGWMAAKADLHPLVVSAWGSDVFRVRAATKRRSRTALEAADAVLADSRALAQAAALLAPDAPEPEVVNWGVDTERFAPGDAAAARERVGIEAGGPVVMGIRGLATHYNPAALLRGFALLLEEVPEARLVLKHPHNELPVEIDAAIEKLGIEDSVRVVGHVDGAELADWYRAADVCVSIPSTDSSPRSVWEALACARPLVVSDLPWAREWLEDGREALLVPARPEPVGDALLSLLHQPELTARLAEGGRALATERMSRDTEMQRAEEVYRRVIG